VYFNAAVHTGVRDHGLQFSLVRVLWPSLKTVQTADTEKKQFKMLLQKLLATLENVHQSQRI